MEDTPDEEHPNTKPQLANKFFIQSEYVFHIDSTNKKLDNIKATALKNTKAYESYFNKLNHFALTFHHFTLLHLRKSTLFT